MRCTNAIVAIAILGAGAVAQAAPNPPNAGAEGDDKAFWARVEHPHRVRYNLLVVRASQLVDQSPADAVSLLREAIALEPDEPLAYWELAEAQNLTQQWAECTDSVQTLLRLRPDFIPPGEASTSAAVDDLAGLCLSLSGRSEEAVAHYVKVLASPLRDPTKLGILHWNLGDCYQALGRLDEAIEQYSLGSVASPQEPMLHFALGVAYDRDEELARGREEVVQGLRIDPQLRRMGERAVVYVPKEDQDYYYGFANQVASEADPPIGDPLRRGLAIVYFRRYLASSASGPWAPRAREHLAELGAPAMREGDVSVLPDVPEKGAIAKALLGAGPDLQKCVESTPIAILRASMVLTPPRSTHPIAPPPRPIAPKPYARSPAPPAIRVIPIAPQDSLIVSSIGPEAPLPEARGCVEQRIRALKLVVSQPTRITVIVFSK